MACPNVILDEEHVTMCVPEIVSIHGRPQDRGQWIA